MKGTKKRILEKILRHMAIKVLDKYEPKIVAVTGSVGKTSTKEMVWTVLSSKFETRKNIKNYNNEIGVPLTILGQESGEGSIINWLKIFQNWRKMMASSDPYPEVLVLEMGADHPGDIQYLCNFVPIKVGILTNIGISHLEHFITKKAITKEKGILLMSVNSDGAAIYNYDNVDCRKVSQKAKAKKLSYGFDPQADFYASDLINSYDNQLDEQGNLIPFFNGLSFKLNYSGKIIPIRMRYCIGKPQIYSALAALAAGTFFEINLFDSIKAIEKFRPYQGRMNLIKGKNNTLIVDDTYNSAPDSVLAALDAIKDIKMKRKIVVLGDMLELGKENQTAHQQMVQAVLESGADLFIAVGKRMNVAVKKFQVANQTKNIFFGYNSPIDAGEKLKTLINSGDLVLVKGSQGMRMEKVVEAIMDQPEKKHDLLVRQDLKWQNKPFLQP